MKGEAYCTNWREIAESLEKIDPVGILPQYKKGSCYGANSKRGSVAGSQRGGSSIASQSLRGDDIHMEDVNQEEEKQEQVAVPEFGHLESSDVLGKRQATTQSAPL